MERFSLRRQISLSSLLSTRLTHALFIKLGIFCLLFFFFLLPIVRLIIMSFTEGHEISFLNYSSILSEAATWSMLKNTAIVVGGATIVSICLGVLFAWLVAYTDIRLKKLLQLFIMLPFLIPSYIMTLAWTQFTERNSFFISFLKPFLGGSHLNLYSYGGLIFLLGIVHYPLVYLLTLHVLRKIPRDLEWAVRASGGTRFTMCKTVTLPLALPGIISGAMLAFLTTIDNFGIPAFLGIPANIPVLSTAIYQEVIGFGEDAFARGAALSVLLGVIVFIFTFLQYILLKRFSYQETGRVENEPRIFLKKGRLTIEIVLWLFLLFISIVPLFSMVGTSFIKAYGLPFSFENMTMEHYKYILFQYEKVKNGIVNSLKLAFFTTIICLFIGTAIAYIRIRFDRHETRLTEGIISLPYALPGMVLALAMILAWVQPIPGWKPGIYGTIWILLIAYVTRFLILQVRSSMTALSQVSTEMEEAAHISGARGIAKWRYIMLPLLFSGVLSGAFLVFITTLTELTVSSLLWSSGSETIGLLIFSFEQGGYTTYSTALSTLILLFLMLTSLIIYLLIKCFNKKVGKV
ncbi:ABC transporter permease [Priestia endophytica]|uniref:ABC transporter permease n=1 Tax=Priestia endophytica TaxID=135735 RepID=A0AAX1Q2B7_9BACI|nr:iron ABC transporter permease [Priestia endophytica]RAS72320.1 ABC transporter permease [Priestia endophytica]